MHSISIRILRTTFLPSLYELFFYLFYSFILDAKWLFHYDQSNPCLGLENGDYPLADVFSYLHCSSAQASYHKCPPHNIFDPNEKKCVSGSHYSLKTFCDHREDGNYQNPWDCHKFVQCSNHKIHVLSCAERGVYDPYHDLCRDDIPCQQVSGL